MITMKKKLEKASEACSLLEDAGFEIDKLESLWGFDPEDHEPVDEDDPIAEENPSVEFELRLRKEITE